MSDCSRDMLNFEELYVASQDSFSINLQQPVTS